jgi:hypothetical protein
MKVILNIPAASEPKGIALINFLKSLDFLTVEKEEDITVPEWHKEIVNERMQTSTKESYQPWSEAQKKLTYKK